MNASIRDAATVLLLRERDALEVFMVKRHGASGFMGGAYVFPGGKVDPADATEPAITALRASDPDRLAARLSRTPDRERSREAALAIYAAAIREVREEVSVELASADALVPWAHWITPSREPKRFDTHFFLTEMPAGQTAEIDRHETTESAWMSPRRALQRHEAGEIFLPPPTLINLLELSAFDSTKSALDAARARSIAPILPKVAAIGESFGILLPWDPDYEATEGESLSIDAGTHPQRGAITRVVLEDSRWVAKPALAGIKG